MTMADACRDPGPTLCPTARAASPTKTFMIVIRRSPDDPLHGPLHCLMSHPVWQPGEVG